MNAVEINNIKKIYNPQRNIKDIFLRKDVSTTALNGVSLDIREGEIFGLLGPNGAGKTSLIKILSTLISPTKGTARIYGHDVIKEEREVKKLIGLINSDERSFFWRLTGRQNLEFFAALLNVPRRQTKGRIEELLCLVGMEREADNRFHYYSTGMKQKLAIVRGLLIQPKILFMDEALRSIDPISSHNIRGFIKHEILDILGGTIVIATHRLDEVEELCDRIAILDKGSVVAYGTKDELSRFSKRRIQYELAVRNASDEVIEKICRLRMVHNCTKRAQMNGKVEILINLDNEEEGLHMVIQEIIKCNGRIQKCLRIEPSLENVFQDIIEKREQSRSNEVPC